MSILHQNNSDNVTPINEDLAVWFGKKKKPKGSSQPKGPWVNICSKDKMVNTPRVEGQTHQKEHIPNVGQLALLVK